MFILLLKKWNVSWICRNNEEENGEAQGDEIRSLGHELEEKEKKTSTNAFNTTASLITTIIITAKT